MLFCVKSNRTRECSSDGDRAGLANSVGLHKATWILECASQWHLQLQIFAQLTVGYGVTFSELVPERGTRVLTVATDGALPYAHPGHNKGAPCYLQRCFMQACHQAKVAAGRTVFSKSHMQSPTAKGCAPVTVQE